MLLRVPGFVGELGAFARGMEIQKIGHIVRVTVILEVVVAPFLIKRCGRRKGPKKGLPM